MVNFVEAINFNHLYYYSVKLYIKTYIALNKTDPLPDILLTRQLLSIRSLNEQKRNNFVFSFKCCRLQKNSKYTAGYLSIQNISRTPPSSKKTPKPFTRGNKAYESPGTKPLGAYFLLKFIVRTVEKALKNVTSLSRAGDPPPPSSLLPRTIH